MIATVRWLIVGWIVLVGEASPLQAQAPAPEAPPAVEAAVELPTADQLNEKIKAAQAAADLAEAIRNEIVQHYQQALSDLQRLNEIQTESAELETRVKQAPEQIKQIENELAQSVPQPQPVPRADTLSDSQFQERFSEIETASSELEKQVTQRSDSLEALRTRLADIPEAITQAKKELSELTQALEAAAVNGEAPQLTQARRTALTLRKARVQAQIALLEQQQRVQDVLLARQTAMLGKAQRLETVAKAREKLWKEAKKQRETRGARQDVQKMEEIQEQTRDLPQAIQDLAKSNTELSRENADLVRRTAQLNSRLEKTESRLTEIQDQFKQTRRYVQMSGLDETVGLLLRSQRERLPSLGQYRAAAADRRDALRQANARQFTIDRESQTLVDIEKRAKEIVAELTPPPAEGERYYLIEQTRTLLTERKQLLDKLYSQYIDYVKTVGKLDSTERQLLIEAEQFSSFIDANLMWSRDAGTLNLSTFAQAGEALTWLTLAEHRSAIGSQFLRKIERKPTSAILLALVWIALLIIRLRCGKTLQLVEPDVGRVRSDSIALSLRAAGVTAVRAVLLPALLWLAAWTLYEPSGKTGIVSASAQALAVAAAFWAVLEFLRASCLKLGLGPVHFRWSAEACRQVRRHLSWAMAVALPLLGLSIIASRSGVEAHRASLGVLAFMAMGVTAAVALAMMLYPRGRFKGALEGERMAKAARFGWLWYPLTVAMPMAPVILAGMGYHYAATQLQYRLFLMVALGLGLVVIQAMALRWLLLTHRRLAYQQTLKKLEEAREQRRKELDAAGRSEESESSSEELSVPQEPERSIDQIASDTRRLVYTFIGFAFVIALWLVWQPVLPALNFLNDVHIWNYVTQVDGVDRQMPITLANLILALLVLAITFVATSSLPGVLQIAILKRLPLEPGVDYAITTLSRYVLLGIGIVLGFKLIGVGWTDVQWLIAALGVGIGFGLQEIVANFISGIIILFERPIRVGDIVDVGGVMGIVSRIRIRATTITDWDRKEYIVPNKDFITGRLLNWTLTNKINRIVINIGVAYGSNIEQTRSILRRVIEEHPLITRDPATLITFEGFGDNALNFVVRTYLPDFDNRLEVIHQLHETIYNELNKAGVAIAFPQRDVHLDTSKPLEIRVTHKEGEKS